MAAPANTGTITCFGEALIDFLATGTMSVGQLDILSFQQFPGGAPANVAVAIARLGGRVRFAGQVGDDSFGHFLASALAIHGVDTTLLTHHPSAPTALAFVSLDERGERTFEFYRTDSADLVLTPDQVRPEWFSGSIFHFCSNTLTTPSIRDVTMLAVQGARAAGNLVSFDVNLRHNLWPDCQIDHYCIDDCVSLADIVKMSTAELGFLAAGPEAKMIEKLLAQGTALVVITDGAGPIRAYTPGFSLQITPPGVAAVDTTAAGDAFVGGMLFGLSRQQDLLSVLATERDLTDILTFAARCGAFAATRLGAFTSMPTAADVGKLPE